MILTADGPMKAIDDRDEELERGEGATATSDSHERLEECCQVGYEPSGSCISNQSHACHDRIEGQNREAQSQHFAGLFSLQGWLDEPNTFAVGKRWLSHNVDFGLV